jgi:excisionase family DNA binding protein
VEAREIAPAAYSIMEFCRAYGLGRSTFYRLQATGDAPRIMAVGRRRLITREAADEWQKNLEARTTTRAA